MEVFCQLSVVQAESQEYAVEHNQENSVDSSANQSQYRNNRGLFSDVLLGTASVVQNRVQCLSQPSLSPQDEWNAGGGGHTYLIRNLSMGTSTKDSTRDIRRKMKHRLADALVAPMDTL